MTAVKYTKKHVTAFGKKFNEEMDKALIYIDDPYYTNRERGFTTVELEIAKWCSDNLDRTVRICEVGCGVGHLGTLLASLGFFTFGIDADATRIKVAKSIVEGLNLNCISYYAGHYPELSRPYDLLVTTNLVSGWWAAQPGTETEKAKNFFRAPAVISPAGWFTTEGRERTPDEFDRLAFDLTTSGLSIDRVSDLIWRVTP